MIDITGYLVVYFTVMKIPPFFFLLLYSIKQLHIFRCHTLCLGRVTKKVKKKTLQKDKEVYDYSEQHPHSHISFFFLFSELRHCCIKKEHGQRTSLGVGW